MPFDCEKCKKTYAAGWPAYGSVCYRCWKWYKPKGYQPKKKKDSRKTKKRQPKSKPTPKKIDYRTYIGSRAWKRKAAAAKKRVGHACTRCGKRSALTVHHLTYERLGRELPEDLLVVCWPCHQVLHPKYNPSDEQAMISDLIYVRR